MLTTRQLKEIERQPKRILAARVEQAAAEAGRTWVLGSPRGWSKQELVSAVCQIEEDKLEDPYHPSITETCLTDRSLNPGAY